MQLLLDVKAYVITGHTYYRVHFSKKQANLLGLQKGDKLLVKIIEHQRLQPINFKEIKLDIVSEQMRTDPNKLKEFYGEARP